MSPVIIVSTSVPLVVICKIYSFALTFSEGVVVFQYTTTVVLLMNSVDGSAGRTRIGDFSITVKNL